MKQLIIDVKKCPQSHRCPSVGVCPKSALSQEKFFAPTIDKDKCITCGKCVKFCPKGAFSIIDLK